MSNTKYGVRHDCCGLRSWGGKELVDSETMAARRCAHASFDPLWRKGHMTRGKAYKLLARELGTEVDETHMAIMPAELARQVPDAVARIWNKVKHP